MFTINLVNAIDIVAGTSYSFPSEQFEYWNVVGNSSNTEGMTIDWVNGNTTIYFDMLYKPDDFTLTLFNNDTSVITEHHYTSGGTSRTIYKNNTVHEIEYIDKDCEEPVIPEPKVITNIKTEKETPRWIWGIILLLIIGIVTVAYYLIKTIKDNQLPEEDEELPEGFELD